MAANRAPSVSVAWSDGGYPATPGFDPDTAYPEYPGEVGPKGTNPVYDAVRRALRDLGLDRDHFDTAAWNPLGDVVRPGDRVVVKPNLVTHEFRASCGFAGDLFSVITHPSVVRAIADYAAIALRGQGSLVIADNPSIDADFDALLEASRLKALEEVYPQLFGIDCAVLDLRPRRTADLAYYGYRSKTTPLAGDPLGDTILDLGRHSFFQGLNPLLFRGVFNNRWETIRHHLGSRHRYSVSNTMLDADVFISVPKLKTHHKVGATLNIKGLVGINSNKNHLVHWRIGFPRTGGDEYPEPPRSIDYLVVSCRHLLLDLLPEGLTLRLRGALKNTPLSVLLNDIGGVSFRAYRGAWSGNDTCWRMAADLYNVYIRDLARHRTPPGRPLRVFSVIDGITAGEGNGPFCPSSRNANVIIAGENLLAVDAVACRLMDFSAHRIPYLRNLLLQEDWSLDDLSVVVGGDRDEGFFDTRRRYLDFRPPLGWEALPIDTEGRSTR